MFDILFSFHLHLISETNHPFPHLQGDDFINSVDVVAGLSLGEYTALTFAGAMTFEDGVKLVKIRGESMQAAADATPSGEPCTLVLLFL